MQYFLLSHARGDDDCYVEEFFHDLCAEVAALTGTSRTADVGFLASAAAHSGDRWPAALAEALSTSPVFIALCSPRYFLNEATGKQFWLFNERLRRYAEDTGLAAPSLVPLMWAATDPPPASRLPFLLADPGQPRRGLRQYLRLRDLRETYRRFVPALARQIVETVRQHHIPAYRPLPHPSATPSAFAPVDPAREHRGRTVHIVVATGSRVEMDQHRRELEYYGKDPAEWTPYWPVDAEPLAERARAVAADRLLTSEVARLDELAERLGRTRRGNDIVVLLVDAWAAQLSHYQALLAPADEDRASSAAVVVPESATDAETQRRAEDLRFAIRRVFRRRFSQPDPLLRTEVQTPDAFDADLAGLLEEAKNRTFKVGRVYRTPPGPPPGDRPVLHGP